MNEVSARPTSGPGSAGAAFCGHCGGTYDGASGRPSSAHLECRQRLAMEPPRYCAACRRRMKVQVTPLGWSAECSRHGVLVP